VRVLYFGFLFAGALLANHAEAASFDCKKASTAAEKLICADSDLSSLDEKLQRSYQTALEAVDSFSRPKLITEQRNWITHVRNICAESSCLSKAYTARIDVLDGSKGIINNLGRCSIPDAGSCRSVVYYRDPSFRISSFNRTLLANRRSARVAGCDRLIDLPVGFANSNHSFGGYCAVTDGPTRSRVMICNDDMMGHFAMTPITNDVDGDQELIEFTNQNCFGG